jgi:hypothetical protein
MFDSRHNVLVRKKNHWKTCIGTILVLFVFSASFAFGAEVLLVVGKKDLRAGDLSIKNHLENRGFNVAIQEDTIVRSEDASGNVQFLLMTPASKCRDSLPLQNGSAFSCSGIRQMPLHLKDGLCLIPPLTGQCRTQRLF